MDDLLSLPAPELAPRLIGRKIRVGEIIARIVETEAYQGEEDLACHASKGRTPRTETLYGAPGLLYCYLCYGIHVLPNIVCHRVDVPAAVLLRGIIIEEGEALVRKRRGVSENVGVEALCNGPGKVGQALNLLVEHTGSKLGTEGCPVELLSNKRDAGELCSGPRVGVAYAGEEWANMPWRWWEKGYPAVAIK